MKMFDPFGLSGLMGPGQMDPGGMLDPGFAGGANPVAQLLQMMGGGMAGGMGGGMPPGAGGQLGADMRMPTTPGDPLEVIRQIMLQLEEQENKRGLLPELLGKIPGVGQYLGSPQFEALAKIGLGIAKPETIGGIAKTEERRRQQRVQSQGTRGRLAGVIAQVEDRRKIERQKLLEEKSKNALARAKLLLENYPNHPATISLLNEAGFNLPPGTSLSPEQQEFFRISIGEDGSVNLTGKPGQELSVTPENLDAVKTLLSFVGKKRETPTTKQKDYRFAREQLGLSEAESLRAAGFEKHDSAMNRLREYQALVPKFGEEAAVNMVWGSQETQDPNLKNLIGAKAGLQNELSQLSGMYSDIRIARNLYKDNFVGMADNWVGWLRSEKTNFGPPEERIFRQSMKRLDNIQIQERSGAAVSVQEWERFKQEIADIGGSELQFKVKAQMIEARISDFIDKNFKLMGVDPAWGRSHFNIPEHRGPSMRSLSDPGSSPAPEAAPEGSKIIPRAEAEAAARAMGRDIEEWIAVLKSRRYEVVP